MQYEKGGGHTTAFEFRHRGYKKIILNSTEHIMLINVKMPTIVGNLTFISMTNTTSDILKARHIFIFLEFYFYEQFHA